MDDVVCIAAIDHVVAVTAPQFIFLSAAIDKIIAGADQDVVAAFATKQAVITCIADQGVCTFIAINSIITVVAAHEVAAIGSGHVVVACAALPGCNPGCLHKVGRKEVRGVIPGGRRIRKRIVELGHFGVDIVIDRQYRVAINVRSRLKFDPINRSADRKTGFGVKDQIGAVHDDTRKYGRIARKGRCAVKEAQCAG